jgi:hypothetical protein
MKTTSLSLLAFLPALTFAFFLPFPIPTHNAKSTAEISPDDICPFIHYIDNELCTANLESNQENVHTGHDVTKEVINNAVYYHYPDQKFDPKELCPLFSYLNKTYCASSNAAGTVSIVTPEIANQIKIVKHMFGDIKSNTTSDSKMDISEQIDPKELCPLIELVDKTFCKSDTDTLFVNTDKIDPKDLCPLLEAIDIKLCS